MGKVEQAWLLTWGDVFGLGGLLFLLLGLPVILAVARKPRLFWPLLLVVNTIGDGPRIMGYNILDEVFTGFIVVGALLRITVKNPGGPRDRPNSFQKRVYALWIGYMVLQAWIGMIVNNDLRLVRWVVFYVILGLLSSILYFRGSEFPFPSSRQTSLILTVTTMVYYVAYVGQGAIAEIMLGPHGRFLTQDYYWQGSAYAVFPTLVATPAAILLLKDRSRKVRLLAWASIGLMMVVAFYFDSRISWLVMFALLGISWRRIELHRIVALALVFLCAAAVFIPNLDEHLPEFFGDLAQTSKALWAPGRSDVSRQLQLLAGIDTAVADWHIWLFGSGIYSHRVLIVPYVQELVKWYLPTQDSLIPGTRDDRGPEVTIYRSVGFVELLIDTGLAGMFLFVLTALLVIRNLQASRTTNTTCVVGILLLASLWLLSNNILDIMMLHLFLMPRGFAEEWARAGAPLRAPARVTEDLQTVPASAG